MKFRRICLMLAVFLLLSACGVQHTEEDEALIRVGFSQVGSESDWRIANTASMVAALSEANGFELLFDNAKQRQENQLLAIRNFIQQDVDCIVLAPITESGWDDVLQRAVRWLEETLRAQGREEAPLRILHIQGTYGATAQLLRTQALLDAVETHPNWEIVAQLPGEYTEAKSYELMCDFLKRGEMIDVIYSENDNMSFGAIQALEEAGIACGDDGVLIISFDAVRRALELCLEGKISLCVECNPLHGPRVETLLRQLERGETLPKQTFVDEVAFDRSLLTEEIIREREY